MKNNFSKEEIIKFIRKQRKAGIKKDIAERIYTSRLLGINQNLVLHGGGNTSVKSIVKDIEGKEHEVIYVKGSGSDLSTIDAYDFPAVKLKPLHELICKKYVSDKEMVNYLRKNLIDDSSPNPSVETLVHSSIQEKFIDHTHANAILELTNRKNGIQLCKRIFGDEVLIIPYVMPGFLLAKKVHDMYRKNSNIKGIILFRHGIFTFGKSASESYSRMIRYVSKAEKYLKSEKTRKKRRIKKKKTFFTSSDIAPIIRGIVSKNEKYIVNFRTNLHILETINFDNSKKFLSNGVITPDHVLRIKPKILVINLDGIRDIEKIKNKITKEIDAYKKNYIKYFKKYNRPKYNNKILDTVPQIIAIQNLGIFSIGKNLSNAMINGDVGEMAIKVIGNIEKKTNFVCISEKDIFDVEYWSLEQAKIRKDTAPLSGTVTIITGGTGVIGSATATKFKKMGSEVIILDLDRKKINQKNKSEIFDKHFCDVRKREMFQKTLNYICNKYGGVDFVISNAGSAFQHEIATISDQDLEKSFRTNFYSHQIVASESVKIMKKQNIGGCLLFNISKQSVNPGLNFGAYGLPKSALLALCKQYALEYGHLGIRSNGINADRIESGLLTSSMIKKRAKARKVSAKEYLKGNLLKTQVTAADVANAFYSLSISKKTTAAVLSVDGGNIEASMR